MKYIKCGKFRKFSKNLSEILSAEIELSEVLSVRSMFRPKYFALNVLKYQKKQIGKIKTPDLKWLKSSTLHKLFLVRIFVFESPGKRAKEKIYQMRTIETVSICSEVFGHDKHEDGGPVQVADMSNHPGNRLYSNFWT